jgi:type IV pilus assembly protein PilF
MKFMLKILSKLKRQKRTISAVINLKAVPVKPAVISVLAVFLLSACTTTSSTSKPPRAVTSAQAKKDANSLVHTKLAQEYMRQNQMGTAKSELEEALRYNSGHSHSNYVMALLMMQLKQYPEAEKYFTRSIQSDRENSSAAHDFGVFLCQTGKEPKSIEYFEIAVSNPLFDRADLSYMRAGECLSKINDPKAEQYLKKALSINSRLRPALLRLAVIKQQSKSYLSARAYIERYFAITEPQPESLLLAYQIESSLNANDVAKTYRKQLLTNFPSSEQARSLRGSGRL